MFSASTHTFGHMPACGCGITGGPHRATPLYLCTPLRPFESGGSIECMARGASACYVGSIGSRLRLAATNAALYSATRNTFARQCLFALHCNGNYNSLSALHRPLRIGDRAVPQCRTPVESYRNSNRLCSLHRDHTHRRPVPPGHTGEWKSTTY